jgi:zinc protease
MYKKKSAVPASILAALVLAALFSACQSSTVRTPPQARPQAEEPQLPLAPDLIEGRLDNGLRYLIRPNAYPEGRAYLYLALAAGSLNEDESQRGLAHFLEHMAFNGTSRYPRNELVGYLQSLGMRFGPEINAYTSFDRTVYMLELPMEGEGALESALDVLADWAFGISIDPEMYEGERAVINEEWRLSQGAQERLLQKQLPIIMGDSLQARRLPIGLPEVFMKAPREEILRFYRDWYRPEAMTVIAVGDFDPLEVQAGIEAAFSGGSAVGTVRPAPDGSIPGPRQGRLEFSAETDPELPYAYIQLMYRLPDSGRAGTFSEYRQSLIRNLIVGMESERLAEGLRDPDSPYAYAGASVEFLALNRSALTYLAMPKEGRFVDALAALLSSKERLKRQGFGAAELEAQKAQYLAYLEVLKNDASKNDSATLAAELVRHAIEGEPVPGIDWEYQAVNDIFASLGLDEVNAAAAAILEAEDLTVLLAAPDSRAAELLTREAVVAAMGRAAASKPAAIKEEGPPKPLMNAIPEPGRIVKEESHPGLGVIEWTLSNGATVYLKPTAFKNDEIVLDALALGGTSAASDADFISARLADGMAAYSGLGDLSARELERSLKGKAAGISRSLGTYTVGLSGSSGVKDLETLFQLVNLHFTGNRIDPEAAQAYLDGLRTALADQEKDPQTVFSLTASETVNGRHPRFMRLRAIDLASADPARALAFLRSAYWAGDFSFSLAGNLDLAEARRLVETYIASIPQPRRGTAWRDLGVERPSGLDVRVTKGTDQKSLVYMAWFAPDQYSYPKFLAGRALKDYLDIKLIEVIRERMGGAYSAGATVSYQTIPASELGLSISFGCDPARVDELCAATEGLLADAAAGRIDAADMDKVREILEKSTETDFQRNATWAATLNQLRLVRGQPLEVLEGYRGLIRSLKASDLAAAAGLFDPESLNRVVLYPER